MLGDCIGMKAIKLYCLIFDEAWSVFLAGAGSLASNGRGVYETEYPSSAPPEPHKVRGRTARVDADWWSGVGVAVGVGGGAASADRLRLERASQDL